jgi:LPS export ABC transporter protein LptC
VSRRILLAATLMLLIVFVIRWWIPSERIIRSIPALPDSDLDYTLTEFKSEFFNSNGVLEWTIEGPMLTHDANSKMATIEKPVIQIDPANKCWLATADQGLILRNEDELILIGNVIIRQPAPNGERIIKTDRLHHHRRQRTITSKDAVEVETPNASIQAGGLLIDLNTETMEFFEHVKGEILMGPSNTGDTLNTDPRSRG